MRTFIAVELPECCKKQIEGLVNRLRRPRVRVSWVRPENMHLTLRFLGDIHADDVDKIVANLRAGYCNFEPFQVRVRGVGAFPNLRKPGVIWAGLESEGGALEGVQTVAEQAARAIGLKPERKRFHPHVTLARIRDPKEAAALKPFLAREQGFEGGEFTVAGVSLFSSELTPKGANYTRIKEFPC